MKLIRIFLITFLSLLLFYCGSVTKIFKPLDPTIFQEGKVVNYEILKIEPGETNSPKHFLIALDSYLEVRLKEYGLMYEGDKNLQVKIEVDAYRMRKGFIKKALGIFGGKDGVQSYIKIIDKVTGKVIGEAAINTSNIGSSTTIDDMARLHANKIANFLYGKD